MKDGCINVTYQQALGLREAMRPLAMSPTAIIEPVVLLLFHEKVLLMLVEFEATATKIAHYLPLSREECLLISQFLSMQDGDWAADVLKQSRFVLYELKSGQRPATKEAVQQLDENCSTEKWVEDSSPGDTGEK